jgi:hypothetical protein
VAGGVAVGKIIALGIVEVIGNNTDTMATVANFEFGSGATLTSDSAVSVTLASAPYTLKLVEAGSGIMEIAGATGLTAEIKGNIKLSGAVTDVTLIGTGNVDFSNATVALTTASIGNSGTINFSNAGGTVTFSGGGSLVGTATFANGFTVDTSDLDVGNIIVPETKVITLDDKALKLEAGKTISVGASEVLKADSAAVLTGSTSSATTLTAASKKLTVGDNTLTLTSGNLEVVAGSTLSVGDKLTITTGTLNVAGLLAVEDTGVIELADDTAIVKIGDTSIFGDGASTLTAGSDTVTFSPNTISATAAASLAIGAGDAEIVVDPNNVGGKTLTVSVDLDLKTKGILTINGGSTPNKVKLLGESSTVLGKLTLGTGSNTITWATNVKFLSSTAASGKTAQITGTDGSAEGASDADTAIVGFIAGGAATPTNDVTITGKADDTMDLSFKAGDALAASAS